MKQLEGGKICQYVKCNGELITTYSEKCQNCPHFGGHYFDLEINGPSTDDTEYFYCKFEEREK